MKFQIKQGKRFKWGIGDYVYLEFKSGTKALHRKTFHTNFKRNETPQENALLWAEANADVLGALICEFDIYGTLCAKTAAQRLVKHLKRICDENDETIYLTEELTRKFHVQTVWWKDGPQGWANKVCTKKRRPMKSHFQLQTFFGYELSFVTNNRLVQTYP